MLTDVQRAIVSMGLRRSRRIGDRHYPYIPELESSLQLSRFVSIDWFNENPRCIVSGQTPNELRPVDEFSLQTLMMLAKKGDDSIPQTFPRQNDKCEKFTQLPEVRKRRREPLRQDEDVNMVGVSCGHGFSRMPYTETHFSWKMERGPVIAFSDGENEKANKIISFISGEVVIQLNDDKTTKLLYSALASLDDEDFYHDYRPRVKSLEYEGEEFIGQYRKRKVTMGGDWYCFMVELFDQIGLGEPVKLKGWKPYKTFRSSLS